MFSGNLGDVMSNKASSSRRSSAPFAPRPDHAPAVLSALRDGFRAAYGRLPEQRVLFFGVNAASLAIAECLVAEAVSEGLTTDEARELCWFFDDGGLVVRDRPGRASAPEVRAYAHAHTPLFSLLGAVESLRPTALVGASGKAGAFTEEVLGLMADLNTHPLVFVLADRASAAECTADAAYHETGGTAFFASASPFPAVVFDGRTLVPGRLAAVCA